MTIDIYRSTTENIQDVIMTQSLPYTFWSAYSLVVPALNTGDVVDLRAQFEVTNPWQFDVQLDRFIGYGSGYGIPQPVAVDACFSNSGDDVPPDLHHKRDICLAVDTGQTGDIRYSLFLQCSSQAITSNQNYLVLEHGYGGIVAIVHRAPV